MALAEIRFYGNSIGVSASMNVLLPDSGPGPFPVLYLLHGLSDDHSMWCRRSNIERHIGGIPMIVVMPSTLRGWYTNSVANKKYAYEDHIIKDVVPLIDRTFPTIARRKGRVLGGLSMGGYGAVKLALKFPDMFCSATSHSGALMIMIEERRNQANPDDWKKELLAIFGPRHRGGPNDLGALAKKCPPRLRPALRIDCGVNDFLIRDNRRFHELLQGLKFPHEYQEFPGAHTWEYWDAHVQEALAFHRRVLKI